MKRVSIKDVAREAGVSATTVSYVLNRNPDETISAETTQRVLEAVRRLHYVPNPVPYTHLTLPTIAIV